MVYQTHPLTKKSPVILTGKTRNELLSFLLTLFQDILMSDQVAILGCDFSFAFPKNFYRTITGNPLTDYREVFKLFSPGSLQDFNPYQFAGHINRIIQTGFGQDVGPFWGPSFPENRKKPHRLNSLPFDEKRICEKIVPKTHSIFQLGGNGSVGLQSLYGMMFLKELMHSLQKENIQVHIWPNMGVDLPEGPAVIVLETYPGILNQNYKSDINDATSIFDFLFETFILSEYYKTIFANISHFADESILIEEGFLYGPIEKIIPDSHESLIYE